MCFILPAMMTTTALLTAGEEFPTTNCNAYIDYKCVTKRHTRIYPIRTHIYTIRPPHGNYIFDLRQYGKHSMLDLLNGNALIS